MPYHLDQDACIGCGICAMLCPELFTMNEENTAALNDPEKFDKEKAKKAEELCPVQAIRDY